VANKQQKKRGRPRKGPLNLIEERAKVKASIRSAAKRRLGVEDIDIDEMRDEIYTITGKHKYTKQEMDDLRERMDLLYQEFVTEVHEREAIESQELHERLRAEAFELEQPRQTKAITPEEWNVLHGLRPDGKKKPGPKPKKKKMVHELAPGECGTAEHPSEPIDVDALEAELEAKIFEDHIEQQKSQPQQLKGKRFRSAVENRKRPNQPKSFWI
jgi:hypothetical protein